MNIYSFNISIPVRDVKIIGIVQLPLGSLLYLLDEDGTWAELRDAFSRLPRPEENFTVQHEAVPPK